MLQYSILTAAHVATARARLACQGNHDTKDNISDDPFSYFLDRIEAKKSEVVEPARADILQFLWWVVSKREPRQECGKWTVQCQFPPCDTPLALGLQALGRGTCTALVTHDLHSVRINDLQGLLEIF